MKLKMYALMEVFQSKQFSNTKARKYRKKLKLNIRILSFLHYSASLVIKMIIIQPLPYYNILKSMANDITMKLNKYVKPWFIPTATLINTLAILYYALPIRMEFYMGVVALLLLTLKFVGGYQYSPLYLIDSNDCAVMLMEKLNIEFIKFNWLINKFTKECFAYSFLAFGIFYTIDIYLFPSISVWIGINLINLYLSFTKLSKNVVKYHLGLYKEYNKYVIHIKEPNNQEQKEDTFEEIFNELKYI